MVLLSCKSNTFPAIIDVLCQKYHCLCCVLCQKALRFGAKCNPFWAKTPPILGQNAELATIPLGYTPHHKHPPTVKMAGAEGELRQG
jgi:hypothetical protein